MDLNHSSASLLFEHQVRKYVPFDPHVSKQLHLPQFAEGAPTEYYFQVTTLELGEDETKRGTQLKVW